MNRRRAVFGGWLAVASVLMGSSGVWATSLTAKDFAALSDVADPQIAPDGRHVVYTARTTDLAKDKRVTQLWLADWQGTSERQLTFETHGASHPRWSADGRSLAFLASRGDDADVQQVWLLEVSGGEARQISHEKGDIEDFVWSPDARQMALVIKDPDPAEGAENKESDKKAPQPIVIDRLQFKSDDDGYLSRRRTHIWLLSLADGKAAALTVGPQDDLLPAWSPDGKSIAFVSKRGEETDRIDNWDLYRVAAQPGAIATALTRTPEADNHPDWESAPSFSPDGRWIAYLHGGPVAQIEYATNSLYVIPAAGGTPRALAPSLDRNLKHPHWLNGHTIVAEVQDDRHTHLIRVDALSGKPTDLTPAEGSVHAFDISRDGHVAMLWGSPYQPSEVYAAGPVRRALSHRNDGFVASRQLGRVEETSFNSADGTQIHGFAYFPPDYIKGQKYPAIAFSHGGPQAQAEADFNFTDQLFAANGYVVLSVNYRGSTGRGTEYSKAIYADWGHKDVQDLLAGVDDAVRRGEADPDRLGIGGWSYGGMLTNYTIARDTRFKAAVSGASISNILAGFGTDEYIRDYLYELGTPWGNPEVWTRISFPFLHADRITTPTLFMGGTMDFNVPLQNQEQMFEALRTLKIPTELVIYPDQHHGFTRPSFILDRYQRWLAWYAQWLSADPPARAAGDPPSPRS